jgi:hypothetical protein
MSFDGRAPSLSNTSLWTAIQSASLPNEERPKGWFTASQTMSFQERLSSKHDLTAESAWRLEDEYRRFLYLKVIDGGTLTPSKRVDQAWHLHIESPGGEWTRFCHEVLKRQVDHQTGLSRAEAKASYARLLDLYRGEFNEEPPSDIWPGVRERRRQAIGIGIVSTGFVICIIWPIVFWGFGYGNAGWEGFAVFAASMFLAHQVSKGTDLETVARCG